jgi:hypothetical protein
VVQLRRTNSLKGDNVTKKKDISSDVTISIEPAALDIKHAAAFLDTAPRQIRTLIYERELQPIRLGKKQLLLVEDLRNFIRSRKRVT